jgi:hypothetical protein
MGYITVDELKAGNGIISEIYNCSDVPRLQHLIDYCSLIINSYTNTDFYNYADETQLVDGEGSNLLRLPKRLYSFTSIKDVINSYVYNNVVITNKNMNLVSRESTFEDDCANIEVVGNWGWETVPQDIITVLIALCNQNFESLADSDRMKYQSGPFKSETLGDWSYDRGNITDSSIETTGDSKLDAILDKYRISQFNIGVV